ncbi:MAG: DNA-directed RNA polymerase subunit omega [Proteobacteria bacterium]|jgi:DNA-directed RNA polymerase subunit omega|nr:DNA-directed RNA polymerase subunit omega [Pseudomonadota bacterium]NLN63019.1 DNA-directed RNA polymerase subunit omega [Myxococcales bacterium]
MARVTVEDCLERVPSRFALVIVAAKRTRQLMKGALPTVKRKNREAVTSLREIAKGSVAVQQDVQELLEQTVENYSVMR